jgi:hypothetical protein
LWGLVKYIPNKKIYGKPYGSGFCYWCTNCGAYVDTHIPKPRNALGILSNDEMRKMKIKCHDIFDSLWNNSSERKKMHHWLSQELGISTNECHFGYFDMDMLNKAYRILVDKKRSI